MISDGARNICPGSRPSVVEHAGNTGNVKPCEADDSGLQTSAETDSDVPIFSFFYKKRFTNNFICDIIYAFRNLIGRCD